MIVSWDFLFSIIEEYIYIYFFFLRKIDILTCCLYRKRQLILWNLIFVNLFIYLFFFLTFVVYFSLGHPDVFDMIQRHSLVEFVQNKCVKLMQIDADVSAFFKKIFLCGSRGTAKFQRKF